MKTIKQNKIPQHTTRLGEKRMAENGMEMEIIAYRDCKHCDIRFENGVIVKNKTYHNFLIGHVGLPTDNRIGQKSKDRKSVV